MGCICISSYRLTNHMNHPVGTLTLCNQGIQCPSRRPHDVAACFIIFWVFYCNPAGMNERAHQAFCDIVRGAVVLSGKILLCDMVKNIIESRYHLIFWQSEGVSRIEDCKLRKYLIPKHVTDLAFLTVVCDNCTAVHFRAGSYHGQNTTYRNNFAGDVLHLQIIFFPWIFFAVYRNRYRFGIITNRTASDRQNKIYVIFFCKAASFIQLFNSWIWHNTRIFNNRFSACFQDIHYLIVNTIFLNGTTSIAKHHCWTIFGQFIMQIIQ